MPAFGEPKRTRSGAEWQGALARGELAAFLYHLGFAQVSGSLSLMPAMCSAMQLTVIDGALVTPENDPLGRVMARRLASMGSMRRVRYRITLGSLSPPLPDGRPHREQTLSLSRWARSHIESQLDTQHARRLLTELAGPELMLAPEDAPPNTICDDIDRRIVVALETPQPLHSLWRQARTSRFRLLSFLHFLRAVGALQIEGAAQAKSAPTERSAHEHRDGKPTSGPSESRFASSNNESGRKISPRVATQPHRSVDRDAERRLGVIPGADRDTIRRAFHRRVRALHPDLHPNASRAQQRRLEHALADVTDAYETLLDTAAARSRKS